MKRKDLDERTQRALEASFFGAMPSAAIDRLLSSAILVEVPAGGVVYRAEDPARGGVVIVGLVRIFLTSPEGRQVTVRYVRPGSQLGAATALYGPFPAGAQAVTDSSVLWFSAAVLREVAKTDGRVAWLLAEEMSRILAGVLEVLAGTAFGSVRQRVARHLLDLATSSQRGAELVADVSQQDLADAVATAREVVARTLRDLREAGLIRTGRSGIVLVDPERLEAVVTTGEV